MLPPCWLCQAPTPTAGTHRENSSFGAGILPQHCTYCSSCCSTRNSFEPDQRDAGCWHYHASPSGELFIWDQACMCTPLLCNQKFDSCWTMFSTPSITGSSNASPSAHTTLGQYQQLSADTTQPDVCVGSIATSSRHNPAQIKLLASNYAPMMLAVVQ
jgi:hypothetical protein